MNARAIQRLVAVVSALAAAWIAFAILVWLFGDSPRVVGELLLEGTWGTGYGVGQVLFKATPLLCAGVAFDVGRRAGLFNIGGEGQIAMASLAVASMGARAGSIPPWIAVPLLLLVAGATGGAWAAVPAFLRTRFGAHEVISTIMMNRIADALIGAAFGAGLAVAGSVRTQDLAPSARLPRVGDFIPALRGSAASVALIVAVAVAFTSQWFFRRARLGREITQVGENPLACAAVRIPVGRRIALAFVASGAIAGLASAGTVLGYKGYYEMGLGAGAGFGGLAVALLGGSSAVGLVMAALLFGTLQQGGLAINAHVPREAMDVLQAVVILAVSLGDANARRRLVGPATASGTA